MILQLRKASERIQPGIRSKLDERHSLLEQIRTKVITESFSPFSAFSYMNILQKIYCRF